MTTELYRQEITQWIPDVTAEEVAIFEAVNVGDPNETTNLSFAAKASQILMDLSGEGPMSALIPRNFRHIFTTLMNQTIREHARAFLNDQDYLKHETFLKAAGQFINGGGKFDTAFRLRVLNHEEIRQTVKDLVSDKSREFWD